MRLTELEGRIMEILNAYKVEIEAHGQGRRRLGTALEYTAYFQQKNRMRWVQTVKRWPFSVYGSDFEITTGPEDRPRDDETPAIGLRLVDTTIESEVTCPEKSGKLEVLYKGTWGAVCDDGFNSYGALVACNELGYSNGEYLEQSLIRNTNVNSGTLTREYLYHDLYNYYKAYGYFSPYDDYGDLDRIVEDPTGPTEGDEFAYYYEVAEEPESTKFWLSHVSCLGTESSLRDCPHSPLGENTCVSSEAVKIRCHNDCGAVKEDDGHGYPPPAINFTVVNQGDRWLIDPAPQSGSIALSGNATRLVVVNATLLSHPASGALPGLNKGAFDFHWSLQTFDGEILESRFKVPIDFVVAAGPSWLLALPPDLLPIKKGSSVAKEVAIYNVGGMDFSWSAFAPSTLAACRTAGWLSFSGNSSGNLVAGTGARATIPVVVSAAGLAIGHHETCIMVNNSLDNDATLVPIAIDVWDACVSPAGEHKHHLYEF